MVMVGNGRPTRAYEIIDLGVEGMRWYNYIILYTTPSITNWVQNFMHLNIHSSSIMGKV